MSAYRALGRFFGGCIAFFWMLFILIRKYRNIWVKRRIYREFYPTCEQAAKVRAYWKRITGKRWPITRGVLLAMHEAVDLLPDIEPCIMKRTGGMSFGRDMITPNLQGGIVGAAKLLGRYPSHMHQLLRSGQQDVLRGVHLLTLQRLHAVRADILRRRLRITARIATMGL